MEKSGRKQVKREKQERKVSFDMTTVLYPSLLNFLRN